MIRNIKLSNYLNELKGLKCWIPWMQGTDGKKKPSLNGLYPAKYSDPDLLMAYTPALSLWQHTPGLSGLGFVVPAPYCVVDLDDCFDKDGNLNPIASSIIETLDSYTELSPSGKGIHTILKANLVEYTKLAFNQDSQSVEIITPGNNFVTFTGNSIRNVPIADRTSTLEAYYKTAGKVKKAHDTNPPPISLIKDSNAVPNYKYGSSVLEKECAKVRSQHKGTRTNTLRDAARNIGQLTYHIEDEASAVKELERAGMCTGLTLEVCKETVMRGIEYGKKCPRNNVPKPYGKLILRPK